MSRLGTSTSVEFSRTASEKLKEAVVLVLSLMIVDVFVVTTVFTVVVTAV